MAKRFSLLILILVIIFSSGIIYLNKVYLPVKIKSLVIQALSEQTGKEVSLGSLQFHIFKGLVLKEIVIKDATRDIASIEEASCSFLIWPFFKKQIIIPGVRIKSATVYLERRADNTINLEELFVQKKTQGRKAGGGFDFIVSRVRVLSSRIDFQDNTFSPAFTKSIEDINLILNLSLPAALKFKLKAQIPANDSALKISASGQYNLLQKQLTSKVNITNFAPSEFSSYYQKYVFFSPVGLINAKLDVILDSNFLNIGLKAQATGIELSKNQLKAQLDSGIQADFKYNLQARQLEYSGGLDIGAGNVSGLQFVDTVQNISGSINFNNSGLSSGKLNADILEIPVEAKLKLTDFNNPLLSVNLSANPDLSFVQSILNDRFKISFPGKIIKGTGKLLLNLEAKPATQEPLQINGEMDIFDASLKFKDIDGLFDRINGKLVFDRTYIKWMDLNFQYKQRNYQTSGVLNNFQNPEINLKLSSLNLALQSIFRVKDKLVNIQELSGKYFNSGFLLYGTIDLTSPALIQSKVEGELNIELADLEKFLKGYKEQLIKIKPAGKTQVEFSLFGNLNDLKSCLVQASVTTPSVSIYGLKSGEASMQYNQSEGIIDISALHVSLYGGVLDAVIKMNLNSPNLPYLVDANIQNVRLEKLKLDTAAKERDISGIIQMQARLNGFIQDFSKLSGQGRILVNEGKLWQIDFFKGIGKLLFISDFSNVVFHEGSCNFIVADKYISTGNLMLKSDLVDLSGSVQIGFDTSVDAALKAKISAEAPLTGSVKDIVTTILGQAEKFGTIKISGTFKDLKYSFQPAVVDIINTLKDIFLNK